MSQFDNSTIEGKNFSAVQVGKWEDLLQYKNGNPFKAPGKVFLKDKLQCTGMEVSLNVLPPGISMPFIISIEKMKNCISLSRRRAI